VALRAATGSAPRGMFRSRRRCQRHRRDSNRLAPLGAEVNDQSRLFARFHTAGHPQLPIGDLRAGPVKARRPRGHARAKRSGEPCTGPSTDRASISRWPARYTCNEPGHVTRAGRVTTATPRELNRPRTTARTSVHQSPVTARHAGRVQHRIGGTMCVAITGMIVPPTWRFLTRPLPCTDVDTDRDGHGVVDCVSLT